MNKVASTDALKGLRSLALSLELNINTKQSHYRYIYPGWHAPLCDTPYELNEMRF